MVVLGAVEKAVNGSITVTIGASNASRVSCSDDLARGSRPGARSA